ncbi:De-etiolated protein 1 Det1 [Popillia japonica]|uniref:De-etiolated protein 1 Det1 n=1 Tax=Popillia japonica TaxID=7064 RepID=A0AAW1NAQ3_POPJA
MDSFIKPRKVPPQNVVIRLFHRQIFGSKKSEVYRYKGPAAAGDLLQNVRTKNEKQKFEIKSKIFDGDLLQNVRTKNEKQKFEIKSKIFDRFFQLKFVVNVSQSLEQLNRECSLFSDDGRYVIVGSATFIPEELRPHFYEIYTNNESVTPNPRSPLEDYSLHLVDLHAGKLCDTRQFKVDKIFLSHNQGLYLYKDILAVLSVQHQVIHIFQLLDGMFVDVRKIGRFCFEDDSYFFNLTFPTERAFKEIFINSLKHRLLAFLYRRALYISNSTNNRYEIRRFYQYFENFKSLRLWKMQLLDENHILINMTESKILAIYENTSRELLNLFENFCDSFRNASIYTETQFTCSPSNNLYARLIQHRFKQTIVSAKFGGKTEATKRLLAQLPISAQSYSSSPYLDLSLFSYDDKWVSVMERPKPCGEHPIRFYARDSGYLKFRIYAGGTSRSQPQATRRLVAFTFHPTDPFAISVQRTNSEYIFYKVKIQEHNNKESKISNMKECHYIINST